MQQNNQKQQQQQKGGGDRKGPLSGKPPTNVELAARSGGEAGKKRTRRRARPARPKSEGGAKRLRDEDAPAPTTATTTTTTTPNATTATSATVAVAVAAEQSSKRALTESEARHRAQVFSESSFASVAGLGEATLRAVRAFGFPTMTRIQALAIPALLQGRDVLIRAKTGHGKTLAFGIPLFECLLANRGGQGLVIAPTRELALQTKEVFEKLAHEHKRKLTCFIGGTNMKSELRSANHERPDVLIATPGRLLDHLNQNPKLMANLAFLVLDEADRLLDEGFQRDMEAIFRLLPTERRTVLASATLPANLALYKHLCLRDDHVSVSAIEPGSDATNTQLVEKVMVVSLDSWLPVLFQILSSNVAKGLKTILFLQAAQQTRLLAFMLSHAPALVSVFEIHSRLSQSQRVRQLEGFKAHQGGSVLCSSDVGARGWDIDGVDMVVQLGIPSDNDTYVHRVGRTARAGTNGEAICLCFDFEKAHFFARYGRAKSLLCDAAVPTLSSVEGAQEMLRSCARDSEFSSVLRSAYSAFLGYHNSMRSKHKLGPAECVRLVNKWICSCGVDVPPSIEAKAVGKMGLKGTEGLRIENLKVPKNNGGGGGQRGGGQKQGNKGKN